MELVPVDHMDEVVRRALLARPEAGEVMKYPHFDAILLPGLDSGWQSPPAPAG
jgi:hypothetical protein